MSDADLIPDLYRIIKNLRSRIEALENDQQIAGASNLPDLTDTAIDVFSLGAGQVLTYDTNLNAWKNGSGSGSGFPVGPFDDGTATHEILTQVAGSPLDSQTVSIVGHDTEDAVAQLIQSATTVTGVGYALNQLISEETAGAGAVSAPYASVQTETLAGGAAQIIRLLVNDGTGNTGIAIARGSGSTDVQIDGDGLALMAPVIVMANLPTADPGNPGQLYQVAGVLMVSP